MTGSSDCTGRVTFRCPDELADAIDEQIKRGDASNRSEFIRRAIRNEIRRTAGEDLETTAARLERCVDRLEKVSAPVDTSGVQSETGP